MPSRRRRGSAATADPRAVQRAVDLALAEDHWTRDVTTRALGLGPAQVRGVVTVEAPGVVSGIRAVRAVARRAGLAIVVHRDDGAHVRTGQPIVSLSGRVDRVLGVERTVLNFLMHLSGVATATARAVAAARPLRVYATRKTTPGLRDLEKAAVVDGGGFAHRHDLSDQVLVKNTHLDLVPLEWAVGTVRTKVGRTAPLQVEVRSLAQARAAVRAGADRVLIDNQSPARATAIVRALTHERLRRGTWIELSGGITPENVAWYRHTGADAVSLGALTHSVRALPYHLRLVTPFSTRSRPRGR